MTDAAARPAALIDSHCHLHSKDLAADRAGVLTRAFAAGVRAVVDIGVDVGQSAEIVAGLAPAGEPAPTVCGDMPAIFAGVGLHPHESAQYTPALVDRLRALAKASPRVVAIGEMGLDYHYTQDAAVHRLQAESFAAQMALAGDLDLPFVVHSRDAMRDTLDLMQKERLRRGRDLRGVMHCFTGDAPFAQACADLGLYISFSGIVTYKNALEIQGAAKVLPRDRILVETDAPFLSPDPLRGNKYYPNEPARVVHTVRWVAKLRGETYEALAAATAANALALFRLDPAVIS